MSFGEELRRERELRDISLRDVAEATKINLRHLVALERNDFAHLPGGVFNRGFVRAYCQFIGVDPEAMVNAYLLEEQSQSGSGGSTDPGVLRGRPSRERAGARVRKAEPERVPRGVPRGAWLAVLLIAAAIVAGIVIYLTFIRDGAARPPGPSPGGALGGTTAEASLSAGPRGPALDPGRGDGIG